MTSLQRYIDRRVLVTGGGSGIGKATVLRVLDEGGRAYFVTGTEVRVDGGTHR